MDCNKIVMVQIRRINVYHFLTDSFIIVLAGVLSFFVAGLYPLDTPISIIVPTALGILAVKLCALALFGVAGMVWRYFSVPDSVRILKATTLSVLISLTLMFLFEVPAGTLRFLSIDYFFG